MKLGDIQGLPDAVSAEYRVTREAVQAYARSINDENPEHLDGGIATPVFAVVPAVKTLLVPKSKASPSPALHGAHDIVFHRPIAPGMRLTTTARALGVRATRAGVVITSRGVTTAADGAPVNEQTMTSIFTGAVSSEWGEPPFDHKLPPGLTATAPDIEEAQALDPDQTRRYGEASGDRSDYTWDDAAARRLGLPGPIVHGLCTMAFAARVVVKRLCGGDSRRLARFAVRFSRLLLMRPGQTLTTRLWRLPGEAGAQAWGCECRDAEETIVVTNGFAVVRPK